MHESHPVLHTVALRVTEDEFGPSLLELCDNMVEVMLKSNGIGLAAPQIGIARQIFVMQNPDGSYKHVINPIVTPISNATQTQKEGCLSYPGLVLSITRPEYVKVEYQDPNGGHQTECLSGLQARCFQHEADHLQGVCFVDGLSELKLNLAKKRLAKHRRV